MEHDSYYQSVCEILREACGVSPEVKLSPQLTLQGDLALDSIALLNLIVELEDTYDFRLDNPLDQPPETLGGIAELVRQLKLGEARV